MPTVTLARPQGFVPPGHRSDGRAVRLSHLDPRPLWPEPRPVDSPWRSPGFCAACAIVLPVAAVARLFRG